MKKLLCALLALTLVLSLGACTGNERLAARDGSSAADVTEATSSADSDTLVSTDADIDAALSAKYNDIVAYVSKSIDLDAYENDDDYSSDDYYSASWSSDYFDLPSYTVPTSVTMADGAKITLGTTKFKDLASKKYTIDEDIDTIAAQDYENITLNTADGTWYYVDVTNDSKKEIAIDDGVITGISLYTDTDYHVGFNYNGATEKSSFKDIVDIFGTPNDEVTISVSSTYSGVTLYYIDEAKDINLSFMFYIEDEAESLYLEYIQIY